MLSNKIADGFKPLEHNDGHIGHNGPYCYRQGEDGQICYGFQTDERHANPLGVLHGGALFSFVDTVFGHLIFSATKRYSATISLTTEFISAVEMGAWVDGKVSIKRLTGSMAFVGAEVYANDQLLMSANGVFKLFQER